MTQVERIIVRVVIVGLFVPAMYGWICFAGAQAQTKVSGPAFKLDDKKPEPPVVVPFSLEESNALTAAERDNRQAQQDVADYTAKLAQAWLRQQTSAAQFNEVANKYPGEKFERSQTGVFTGHRKLTEEEKGKATMAAPSK